MLWNHDWAAPSTVVIRTTDGPVHTARQGCSLCGSQRNPLTQELTYRARGSQCHLRQAGVSSDYAAELDRVRRDLDALEQDGRVVDRGHTGRKPRVTPELPLAYKD